METFGAYLKHLRLEKSFGQRTYAKQIGILPSNLCHIETGRLGAPQDNELLQKMAEVLGLKDGSPASNKFFDLAAKKGQIPADVVCYLEEADIVEELPIMARTIKNKKLTKIEIEKLIEDIKKK